MTNRATEISGRVSDDRSQPVGNYTVLAFPRDSDRWTLSRYVQTSRPDQNDRFKIRGLPAGNYYAIALDYLDPDESTDPEYLERLRDKATALSLAEAEVKTLDLKIRHGG